MEEGWEVGETGGRGTGGEGRGDGAMGAGGWVATGRADEARAGEARAGGLGSIRPSSQRPAAGHARRCEACVLAVAQLILTVDHCCTCSKVQYFA